MEIVSTAHGSTNEMTLSDKDVSDNVDSTDPSRPEVLKTNNGEESLNTNKEPWWKNHIFMPLLFSYMFANNLISTPLTNLTLDRVCKLTLNYSTETCQNMKNYTDVLDQVQVLANDIGLYSTLIKTIPSACLCVLVGPWSDKYGRKPPIYLSLFGTLLTDIGLLVYSSSISSSPYQILLYSIPTGLFGGDISVLGCTYTLAADNTDHRSRTRRYGFLEIAVVMGIPLGTLCAGFIYDHFGYVAVFASGLVFHFVVTLYLFVVIRDKSAKKQASLRAKISEFFSCENFMENVKIAMRKRENNGRMQLWLLLISSTIIYLNYTSVSDIIYLFCNKMYHWDLPHYTVVTTVYMMCTIAALMVAMPLFIRVLKVPDSWLGLIGITSLLAEHSIKAFAYQPWIYYVSLVASVLGPVAPFAVRARLSKSVEDNEMGKLFTVVATLENLVPIPGSVLFTKTYNASIKFFPGLAFLISAATLFFPLLAFLWIVRLPRFETRSTKHPEDETAKSENTNEP